MLLFLHILIAISSLALGAAAVLRPSRLVIRTNYGLITATLASGTGLILVNRSHLMSACLSGLVYTAAVAYMQWSASRHLATQHVLVRR